MSQVVTDVAARVPPEWLETALDLQRKFWTQDKIAAELGLRRETVSRVLSRFNARALRRIEEQVEAEKMEQVSQLKWLAGESVEAWERSKRDAEIIKTSSGGRGGNTTETTIKGQSGNPAFLGEARGALADVRKILALEPKAAQQPEAETDDGAPDEVDRKLDRLATDGTTPECPGGAEPA